MGNCPRISQRKPAVPSRLHMHVSSWKHHCRWLQNGLLNQKLDRPQGRPRSFGEQRNICPLRESNQYPSVIPFVASTLQWLSYPGPCLPFVAYVIFCILAGKFWDLKMLIASRRNQSAAYVHPFCTRNNKLVRTKGCCRLLLWLFARLSSCLPLKDMTCLSSSEHYSWHFQIQRQNHLWHGL